MAVTNISIKNINQAINYHLKICTLFFLCFNKSSNT